MFSKEEDNHHQKCYVSLYINIAYKNNNNKNNLSNNVKF